MYWTSVSHIVSMHMAHWNTIKWLMFGLGAKVERNGTLMGQPPITCFIRNLIVSVICGKLWFCTVAPAGRCLFPEQNWIWRAKPLVCMLRVLVLSLLGQSLKLQDYSRFQQLFDSSIIVDQPSQDQPGPARSVFRAACIALISGVLRLGWTTFMLRETGAVGMWSRN